MHLNHTNNYDLLFKLIVFLCVFVATHLLLKIYPVVDLEILTGLHNITFQHGNCPDQII